MLDIKDLTNKIICDDCMNILKQLPDKSVDLCLCDPPYGINVGQKCHSPSKANKTYGKSLAPFKKWDCGVWDKIPFAVKQYEEICRASTSQIIFGGNYFGFLPASPCWIVWDKDNGTNDYADCELAYTSFKTPIRKIRHRWNGMLQENMSDKDYRQHPTQKPVGVMKWIIENYSQPTDLILDPFCGSGTTCVAAKLLGRNYIGIDISQAYVDIARNRLRDTEESLFKAVSRCPANITQPLDGR